MIACGPEHLLSFVPENELSSHAMQYDTMCVSAHERLGLSASSIIVYNTTNWHLYIGRCVESDLCQLPTISDDI